MRTKRAPKRYTAGEIRATLREYGLAEQVKTHEGMARMWTAQREPSNGLEEVLNMGWSPTFFRVEPIGCDDGAIVRAFGIGE